MNSYSDAPRVEEEVDALFRRPDFIVPAVDAHDESFVHVAFRRGAGNRRVELHLSQGNDYKKGLASPDLLQKTELDGIPYTVSTSIFAIKHWLESARRVDFGD